MRPRVQEVSQLTRLLDQVPPIGLDWSSTAGQTFLAYADRLTHQGVPAAWLAEQLGLERNRFYAALNRYRRTAA